MQTPRRSPPLSRRTFMRAAGASLLGLAARGRAAAAPGGILVGVCRGWQEHATLKALGFDYSEDSVRRLLVPDQPDEAFAPAVEAVAAATLPIRSCNSFYPAEMKLVGPDAQPDAAVAWAGTAARRAARLGIPHLVLGSGAARRIPDGYSRARAEEQFAALCRRLGEAAQAHGVVIATESLNRGETNFLNKLAEVLDLVEAVDHPGFQAVADFFHIAREDEGPDVVRRAGAHLRHCHIAEREKRTAPGTAGDDFRPYFRALKAIGYAGGLSMECGWKDFRAQAPGAVATLRTQWAEA